MDRDLLVEGARNLRDYFQSQGYFEAQVEFKQQKVINDQANVDFLVNTGKRHKLVAITITGNRLLHHRRDSRAHVPADRELPAVPARPLQREPAAPRQGDHRQSLRVQRISRRQGDARSRWTTTAARSDNIAVFLEIEEGPQYLVNSVQVDGVEKLDKTRLLAKLSSVEGQPFSEFNVAVDRDTILARILRQRFSARHLRMEFQARGRAHTASTWSLRFTKASSSSCARCSSIRRACKITQPAPGLAQPSHSIRAIRSRRPRSPIRSGASTTWASSPRWTAAIENPDGETDRKYVLYNMEEAARYSLAVGVGAELGAHRRLPDLPGCARRRRPDSPRASRSMSRATISGAWATASACARASPRWRSAAC